MSFIAGFATGLAKSIDDNLKKSMERTQERIDGMAQYRVTRRRTELERKEKEKDELRDVLSNLASLVDGDIDKAAQIYKGSGGTIASANQFYTTAMKSKQAMGDDFDMAKAFDFITDNAPKGISLTQYLDNFTTGVKKMPVLEDEIGGTGLYGALFKPKVGDQIMRQVETTAPLPVEADKFAVPSAKINYNNFMEAKDYEKKNRFESASTNEATLLKVEDDIFYTKDAGKLKFLNKKRKDLIARIKAEHQKKIDVKKAGATTTSMFSKTNRDKIVNNGIVRGVNDTEVVKSIEGEITVNLEGNEHKIFAGKIRGMKNLRDEYEGTNDEILFNKIKSVEDNVKADIKAYKFDFANAINKRGKTYHSNVNSFNDAIAMTKGTTSGANQGMQQPKIKPGDVVTFKTGETKEVDGQIIEVTKTAIWTGTEWL